MGQQAKRKKQDAKTVQETDQDIYLVLSQRGASVPEQRIGCEVLEASAKLRKSSVDCLSAASFGAARSEQLRLPADQPLERWDASS
ncbi:MAG: hypothetical protein GTO40_19835 [Deltaproteobacteria bacterium]|nr:hypothetical protein [Deltaproteobacteria bacterium]